MTEASNNSQQHPIGVVSFLSDPEAEGVRSLCTHLVTQHLGKGRRGLAVCSPNGGAGRTFVATHLAAAFARVDIKTLIIDGDLKNPGVHKVIQCANTENSPSGLIQYLKDPEVSYSDSICQTSLSNLDVIYSGGVERESQELLGKDRFRRLIEHCLREYDLTIIDTPQSNTSSDARRISSLIGDVLIITSKDVTQVNDVRVLAKQVESDSGRVVGTVLNRA